MIYKHQYFKLNTQSKKVFDENSKELYLTGNPYRMLVLLCEKGHLNLTEIGDSLDRAKDFNENILRQYRHTIKIAIGKDIVEYKNQMYSIIGKVEKKQAEKKRNTPLLRSKEYDEESISTKQNNMTNELKTLEEYLENYFNRYNQRDREVMSAVRRERYRQIRKHEFYSNKDGNTFKDEVLKFYEGGYNYKNAWIKDINGNKIPFLDEDGNVVKPNLIMKKLKNNELELHGNYTLSQLHRGDITINMDDLRSAIDYLLIDDDPNVSLEDRYNSVIRNGGNRHIGGIGHAKGTMFLHIGCPDKYGMWDACTEETFELLKEINNRFEILAHDEVEKYIEINELFQYLKDTDKRFLNFSDVDMFIWYSSTLV